MDNLSTFLSINAIGQERRGHRCRDLERAWPGSYLFCQGLHDELCSDPHSSQSNSIAAPPQALLQLRRIRQRTLLSRKHSSSNHVENSGAQQSPCTKHPHPVRSHASAALTCLNSVGDAPFYTGVLTVLSSKSSLTSGLLLS